MHKGASSAFPCAYPSRQNGRILAARFVRRPGQAGEAESPLGVSDFAPHPALRATLSPLARGEGSGGRGSVRFVDLGGDPPYLRLSNPSGASVTQSDIAREVARRRTFAIISHPDAGKTTLTEKLLLFGGAIQLAGQVRAKGDRRRHAFRLDVDRAGARHFGRDLGDDLRIRGAASSTCSIRRAMKTSPKTPIAH